MNRFTHQARRVDLANAVPALDGMLGRANQIAAGSNGVGGRDETSEDLANTFELAEYDPSRPVGGAPVSVTVVSPELNR